MSCAFDTGIERLSPGTRNHRESDADHSATIFSRPDAFADDSDQEQHPLYGRKHAFYAEPPLRTGAERITAEILALCSGGRTQRRTGGFRREAQLERATFFARNGSFEAADGTE